MTRRFNDNPTQGSRALQIWLVLIGLAHSRQTITYGQLAEVLGFRGAGTLAQLLGPIMFYCIQNELPPLTVLVVNRDTGLPGAGLVHADLNADREAVFRCDWYDLVPPSPEQLKAAANAGRTSKR